MGRLCALALIVIAAVGVAACPGEQLAGNVGPLPASTVGRRGTEPKTGTAIVAEAAQATPSSGWSEPEAIPGSPEASSVQVGVDAAGNVIAAWLGPRHRLHLSIRSSEAGRWARPLGVGPTRVGGEPSLAVAENGAFVLAWVGGPGRTVYAVTGSVSAGPRKALAIGARALDGNGVVEAAIAADGSATVAWIRRKYIIGAEPKIGNIITRKVDAEDGTLAPPVRIETIWPLSLSLAMNARGDEALSWGSCYFKTAGVHGCRPMRVATRSAPAEEWTVVRAPSRTDAFPMGVGIDGQGSPTAVWVTDFDATDPDVLYAGELVAGRVRATRLSTPDVFVDPIEDSAAVDVDARGRAVIAWHGYGSEACVDVIDVSIRTSSSAAWRDRLRLGEFPLEDCAFPDASNPTVLLAGELALVAWTEFADDAPLVRRFVWLALDDAAPPPAASFALSLGAGEPALAANESGLVAAAWSETTAISVIFRRPQP